MNSGNMALDAAFDIVLTVLPIVLALMVFACLIRAIKDQGLQTGLWR